MTTSPEQSGSLLPPWWEEWPGRLEFELDQFDRRGLDARVVEDPREGASRLVVETTVDLDGFGATVVIAVYPHGYPYRRFALYAPDLRLPRHQSPDGNLCVLARGAEHWRPEFLAANFVADDVPRLVRLVTEGGPVLRDEEDPQGEPFTAYYGGIGLGGIVLDPAMLDLDLSDGDQGRMQIRFNEQAVDWLRGPPEDTSDWQPAVGQGLLHVVETENGTVLNGDVADRLLSRYGFPCEGRWVYLSDPPRTNTPRELWDAVVAASPPAERWTDRHEGLQLLGLCTREEVEQGQYAPAWVFLARTMKPKQSQRRKKTGSGNPAKAAAAAKAAMYSEPTIVRGLRYTDNDLGVRIPDLAPLRTRTVSVVGLGSLGAPFVQELVKSRVGHLRLSDHDFLDPATSVRHPLGLGHAGVDKGLALAQWAQWHDPGVEIDLMNRMFGAVGLEGDEVSEQETLTRLLTDADLFVSATAEHDINRQFDAAALRIGVPRLFMWSQSGYGGVVALLQEGRTGCFHCLSLYLSPQNTDPERHTVGVPPADPDGQAAGTIQGRGCADKTFTAAHADLLPLSIQAARVAYGHLCGQTDDGYPAFDDDVFVVQVRRPDGQPIAPQWSSLRLPPNPDCPICSPA